VSDIKKTWRIVYRIDDDAIVIADVFEKKTRKTPRQILANCQRRLRSYDEAAGEE
jgi:phage-related protein